MNGLIYLANIIGITFLCVGMAMIATTVFVALTAEGHKNKMIINALLAIVFIALGVAILTKTKSLEPHAPGINTKVLENPIGGNRDEPKKPHPLGN